MKLTPVGHKVLVRLRAAETTSKGGIIVAVESDVARKTRAMQEATVVQLGRQAYKGFDDGKPWCKKGDVVLIAKYSGEDRIDPATKEVYRIINDEDVFAILED